MTPKEVFDKLMKGEKVSLADYEQIKDRVTSVVIEGDMVYLNKQQKHFYTIHNPIKS